VENCSYQGTIIQGTIIASQNQSELRRIDGRARLSHHESK
jgi:hypothetical protein